MRILFAIRGLNVGGAERQLVALARGLRRRGQHVSVAVFYGGGAFEEELCSDGIRVHHLGKRGRWDLLTPLVRLARLARAERPDILHAYMGLANLCSVAVKPLFPGMKVVWGIRTSMDDLRAYDWLGRIGPTLDRIVSPWADAVVTNSQAARRRAIECGVNGSKIAVIPNGIDCDWFRPAPEERAWQRERWGIPEGAVIVGIVARLDPVKDHTTFLRAAARVAAARGDVRFVCVGDGPPGYRRRLEQLASDLGLSARITWSVERKVTRAVYSALDLAVLSSSRGESFPNVVAEAMACGAPCVVSDSGDAPLIVGDTGAVVPPGDPVALSQVILDMLERARSTDEALRARARARIERDYSVELLVSRTEGVLHDIRNRP
jgi:glycosyltransferase involved in cell wall biosynthesis